MKKRYFLISGNVSGYYRTQNILKYFSDRNIEYIKIPHFPQIYFTNNKILVYLLKLLSYLVGFPARVFYISVSEVIYITAMNTMLANVVDAAIGRLLRKRVIYDFYISKYDSEVLDRERIQFGSIKARVVKYMDMLLYSLSSEVLFLFETEKKYYQTLLGLSDLKKSHVVTLCVDHRRRIKSEYAIGKKVVVCWWGTYIALHGLDRIIKAFTFLDGNYCLYIFGNDEKKSEKYQELILQLNLEGRVFIKNDCSFSNGCLEDFLVDRCDIALGSFGSSQKAKSVLTNKLLDSCALGIPMVTFPSRAVNEYFEDKKNVFYSQDEPAAIAKAIVELASDVSLRGAIGQNARANYLSSFSPEALYTSLDEFI